MSLTKAKQHWNVHFTLESYNKNECPVDPHIYISSTLSFASNSTSSFIKSQYNQRIHLDSSYKDIRTYLSVGARTKTRFIPKYMYLRKDTPETQYKWQICKMTFLSFALLPYRTRPRTYKRSESFSGIGIEMVLGLQREKTRNERTQLGYHTWRQKWYRVYVT